MQNTGSRDRYISTILSNKMKKKQVRFLQKYLKLQGGEPIEPTASPAIRP
jgi:hypothetical protein